MAHRPFSHAVYFAYGTIGDFVLNLSMLNAMHAAAPAMRIIVFTTRQAPLYREVVRLYPHIKVYSLRSFTIVRVCFALLGRSTLVLLPVVSGGHIPAIRLLARLLSFPRGVRAGIRAPRDKTPLDYAVPLDITRSYHENLSALLAQLGFPPKLDVRLAMPEDPTAAAEFKDGSFIALAPFAGHYGKTFPASRWTALLAHLGEAHPERGIAILGAPSDAEAAEALIKASGHANAKIFCGVSFAETVGLMKKAALFIGVDSGLTHVAAVLWVKSVIIGNLRNPSWLPYYNPNAAVLFSSEHCKCQGDKSGECYVEIDGKRYLRCMMDISDAVLHASVADAIK